MKGTVKLFIIILVLLVSVSAVEASDDNQTSIQADDSEEVLTHEDLGESQLLTNSYDVRGDDFKSIQDVIDKSADGDTIYLGDKTFKSKGQTILVNKSVTIVGGLKDNSNVYATLDGEKHSRIMVISANVTLKGITFVNGNASDLGSDYDASGGAIYVNNDNNLSVLNCTFNNNTAICTGGAIFSEENDFLSCEDCVFNFNHADSTGGAMNIGSAVDCVFNFNYANVGGAIGDGSAVDCVFNFNHADSTGGAMGGSAVGCIFNNNSAGDSGGAMFGSDSAVGCIFNNNSAVNYGGAMWGGSAMGCVFNYNSVAGDGGAMWAGSAVDCVFNFNSAGGDGGAMWGVSAVNCVFINNTAGSSGGAMWAGSADSCIFTGDGVDATTNIFDPVLRVFNYTSSYNSGERLRFNLTSSNGMPITNRNITVDIFKDNRCIGTFNCLSGESLPIALDSGSYIAVCRASDYGIDPVNMTLTISKANYNVVVFPMTVTYNSDKYLTVTLRDDKDNPVSGAEFSVNLNGIKRFTTDKNGQIKVPTNNLVPKTYTVKITFKGNANYHTSEATVKVTVKKATPKLTAKKKTFKKSKKVKKYTVTLKNNKKPIAKVKLTLKIKNKKYAAKTNKNGKATFKIKKLTKKGKYKATITFKANKYYNKATKKVKITVR